jgi:hypothetical protein
MKRTSPPSTLSIRIGAWFEAQASGWGVAAATLLLVVLVAANAFGWLDL